MKTSIACCLAVAALVPGAAVAQSPGPEQAPPRGARPIDVSEIRSLAVYPFTSSGNVDTFWTTTYTDALKSAKVRVEIIDPFELSIHIPDGQPFYPEGRLEELMADARAKGADAFVVGTGKKYSMGFRLEVRVIDAVTGKVLVSSAGSSGIHLGGGPPAKRELAEHAADVLHDAMKRRNT